MSAFLTGDTVTLHPAAEDDVEFFARAWNDHRLRTPLLLAEPTTHDEMRESLLEDEGARFVVRVDDGRVGACSLFRVDERHGRGMVSYWIRPSYQGEGYASDALDAVCEYAFRERRLHKLRAGLVASNDASAGVLESVGFQEEARLEDEFFYDGEYADERRYRLLENEYR